MSIRVASGMSCQNLQAKNNSAKKAQSTSLSAPIADTVDFSFKKTAINQKVNLAFTGFLSGLFRSPQKTYEELNAIANETIALMRKPPSGENSFEILTDQAIKYNNSAGKQIAEHSDLMKMLKNEVKELTDSDNRNGLVDMIGRFIKRKEEDLGKVF